MKLYYINLLKEEDGYKFGRPLFLNISEDL